MMISILIIIIMMMNHHMITINAFHIIHHNPIIISQSSLTSSSLSADITRRSNIKTSLSSSTTSTSSYMLDGKSIRNPIIPVGNYIIVKLKDTLQATSGGILLPDQSKERPTEGIVIEAGPGKIHPYTGVRITNPIIKGMSVVFGKYDGSPIEYNGEDCLLIRDDNVLLIYNDGVSMRYDNIIPIRDWVLIELEDLANISNTDSNGSAGIIMSSGIVLSQNVLKDSTPCQGKVMKIAEGRMNSNGTLCQSPINIGDMVKFKDYAGNDIMIENKYYSVVKMVDILCTYIPKEKETK